MDSLLECVVEFIVEGCIAVSSEKNVPLGVQALIVSLLVPICFGGVIVLFSYETMLHKISALILAIIFCVVFVRAYVCIWKEQKKLRERKEE